MNSLSFGSDRDGDSKSKSELQFLHSVPEMKNVECVSDHLHGSKVLAKAYYIKKFVIFTCELLQWKIWQSLQRL